MSLSPRAALVVILYTWHTHCAVVVAQAEEREAALAALLGERDELEAALGDLERRRAEADKEALLRQSEADKEELLRQSEAAKEEARLKPSWRRETGLGGDGSAAQAATFVFY